MPWQIIAVISFGLGFYFAVYILDKYYRETMKKVINEIHKSYLTALKNKEKR